MAENHQDAGRIANPFENSMVDLGMINEVHSRAQEVNNERVLQMSETAVSDARKWRRVEDAVNLEKARTEEGLQGALRDIEGHEAGLAHVERSIEANRRVLDDLRSQERELGYRVLGKENVLGVAESDLRRVEADSRQNLARIEEELRKKKQEIDDRYNQEGLRVYWESVDERQRLQKQVEMCLSDMEAGRSLTNEDKDERGVSNLDRLIQIYGEDSDEVRRAKQTAVGGEMAAEATTAAIEEEIQRWFEKNKEIEVRRKMELAEAIAESVRVETEEIERVNGERDSLEEVVSRTRNQIQQMQEERDELGVEIGRRGEWLDSLYGVRELAVRNLGELNSTVTEYRRTLEKCDARVRRILEKTEQVMKRGGTAVEALGQIEQLMTLRLAELDLEEANALQAVTTQESDQREAVNIAYQREVSEADREKERADTALEDRMIAEHPEVFYRDEEGEFRNRGGVRGVALATRFGLEVIEPALEEIDTRAQDRKKEAGDKTDEELKRQREEAEAARAIIEDETSSARMVYQQSLETARLVRGTAETYFGTAPVTETNKNDQRSLVARATNFFTQIFKKKNK